MRLFGGIESGGTKFICLIGRSPDHIVKEECIPTTTPEETIRRVIEFFEPFSSTRELTAVGIGSFGPVDLNQDSDTYGFITTTPKLGWQNIDLRGQIQRGLEVPVAFDTDVNVAAFGEQFWIDEKRLLDPFLYLTVGTGIGVGVIVDGKPLHGLIHPEAGHITVPHDRQRDPFPGVCPYHGDCFEGLASGPSLNKRWDQKPETIPQDHPAWDLEAAYIAFAIVNYIYAYSPRQIVFGGGVSQHPGLINNVRSKIQKINHGYVHSTMLLEKINDYIRLPKLGNRSGALGAMAMAINTVEQA
jgi:fructokinase